MSVGNGKLGKPDWDTVSSTVTNTNQLVPTGSLGSYTTSNRFRQESTFSTHATTLAVSTPTISGSGHNQTTCTTRLPKDETQGIRPLIGSTAAKSTIRGWLNYEQQDIVSVPLVNGSVLARPPFIEVFTVDERSAELARDRVGPLFLEVS